MIRNNPPFNGKRFVLTKNTNEIHDLLNEKSDCQIDEISLDHIQMFDTLEEASVYLIFNNKQLNGCYYCLKEMDRG